MAKKKRRAQNRSRSRASAGTRGRASPATSSPATTKRAPPKGRTARSKPAPPARATGPRRWLFVLGAGVLLLGGFYLWQWHQSRRPAPPPQFLSPAPSLAQPALPGLQTGPPPWGTAAPELRARLETIGLPVLSAEATTLHIHMHIDVFVHGNPVTVPADIGINTAAGYLSPLHTHDDSGLIHVESPTDRIYTLGQFFDVWGVRFTDRCVGGSCDRGEDLLRVFVGGKPIRGDPRLLELALHQEIVVTYGTAAELPRPIPSTYSFPLGA